MTSPDVEVGVGDDVDVVVVTYNSAELVGRALASLPVGVSVTVVDNASSDGSADVAAAAGADVIAKSVNAGFGASCNEGARRGDRPYILFLNPDASLASGALERMVGAVVRDPALGVVTPRIRYDDGGEQQVQWPFPSASGAWREAFGLHRILPEPRTDGFVIGACFLVRRDAFEQVGGFDASFWLYSEETDLCSRIGDAGWAIAVVDDAWARHAGGASGEGISALVFDHAERGGEHVVVKRNGRGALVSYRLANLAGAAIRAVAPGPSSRRELHGARVRRLADVLRRHPTAVAFDSPATAAPREGLVVCSLEQWDEVWRRNQFLVRELLEIDPDRRVLFVEPAYDWIHERRHPSDAVRARGLRPLDGDGRILRLQPGKVLPRVLGPLADRSLRRQVRRAADSLGFTDPVLWVNDPAYAGLATETGWTATYDITDDWTQVSATSRAGQRLLDNERQLFQECATIVVCSDGLASTRRVVRPDLVVIPNAVDVEHLTTPRVRPDDLPVGPVAVYVGTLHSQRIDVPLVVQLATAEPEWTFVLVGPNSLEPTDVASLAAVGNITLLGPRPYESVPAYLQHADRLIVPHVVSSFTDSLDPIKAYELLAVARPTLVTPVAGFRELHDSFVVAAREDFVDAFGAMGPGGAWSAGDGTRPKVASWRDRALRFDRALAAERGPDAPPPSRASPGRGRMSAVSTLLGRDPIDLARKAERVVRAELWKRMGWADVGPRAQIGRGCRRRVEPGGRLVIGAEAEVDDGVTLAVSAGGVLRIGDRSFIGHHSTLSARQLVDLGERTFLAELVSVRDHDHDPQLPPSSGAMLVTPVHIGDDVWLASKVTVLRGVTIGDRSVAAAGAVVRADVEAGEIVGGVPAEHLGWTDQAAGDDDGASSGDRGESDADGV